MILDQVDVAVVEHQPDVDLRNTPSRNSTTTGSTCSLPNTSGAVTIRSPFGDSIFAGRRALGLGDVLEDAPRRGQIAAAGIGQAERRLVRLSSRTPRCVSRARTTK